MTVKRLCKLNALPDKTQTPGFRKMVEADIPQAKQLLDEYLAPMRLAPDFDTEDFKHWLLTKPGIVYSYKMIQKNHRK